MNGYSFRWVLFIAAFSSTACQTLQSPRVLEKNAQADELRQETSFGVPMPPGCSQVSLAKPPGKNDLTVSYQEPTTDQNGAPLTELAFTTVYLSSGDGSAQAIRVWTNDPHGGAKVTIHHVVPPADKFALCVTATNWARIESPPEVPQTPAIP